MTGDSCDKLGVRLAETIAWCAGRVRLDHLQGCLRTRELEPRLSRMLHITAGEVDALAERRAQALRAQGRYPEVAAGSGRLGSGRLLVFDPESSLSDGAAAAESGDFFDDDNVPPWDTWVGWIEEGEPRPGRWSSFDRYILVWVPGELVEVVGRGVYVNPEECLVWADELMAPLGGTLRRAGWI